MKENIGSGN